MTTVKFHADDFAEALSRALEGTMLVFEEEGYIGGELRYSVLVKDDPQVFIKINSSIGRDGYAADTGQNSIRIWFTDAQDKPLGNKTQRWVTRQPGWEQRLADNFQEALRMAERVDYCPTCDEVMKVFVTKRGENKGRAFRNCNNDCNFVWLDELDPEAPTCPDCGHIMVRRNGQYGEFWGCTTFPKCRGTRNIKDTRKEEPKQVRLRIETDEWGRQPVVDPVTGDTVMARLDDEDLEECAKPPKKFTPSKYQQAIFDEMQDPTCQHMVVEACAGSGKTTTGVKMLDYLPRDLKIELVAFNRHIAKEMAGLVPSYVSATTCHSLGFADCREGIDGLTSDNVDNTKVRQLFKQVLDWDRYGNLYRPTSRLVSLVKANLVAASDDQLEDIADNYGIVLNGQEEVIFQTVRRIVRMSAEITDMIDFDDMVWLPIVKNLPASRRDVIFADECLPYKTPVQLADGSWQYIGDIVEDKQDVKVLSYDEYSGEQRACRVTGWHKIRNAKRLVKIRAAWLERHGRSGYPHNFVVCTEDHKIWTTKGWVEAGKLRPGMKIQVETSAHHGQHYKITKKGRKTLSKEMARKNEEGVAGTHVPGGWSGERGGNGKALPIPQRTLLEALGSTWEAEYVVTTTPVGGLNAGYPAHYKIDVADPVRKIAVEVDGSSHKGREEQDARKDAALQQMGWKVYRYSNDHVMLHLKSVVEEVVVDCPVLAEVVSVEESGVKDWYVYDITVEDCHNFYANGILVHNCQDLNKAQIQLILRHSDSDTRIIAVGDRYQSMYGFRGADVNAIPNIIDMLDAETMPLSITYRCPTSVVDLVNQRFPNIPIEAAEWAREGVVRHTGSLYGEDMRDGDMVLCRTNAPLVRPAFSLIRRGVKAVIVGRSIGKGLVAMIDKMQAYDLGSLISKLSRYRDEEYSKLILAGKKNRAQVVEDKVNTILAVSDGCHTIDEVTTKILNVFRDDVEGVAFSTVHRAKGLESDRVFILHPELMPHPKATLPWELEQERNIEYVAYTRTKNELVFVDNA